MESGRFWDGSSKINQRSGCGIVIQGVDRNKWITISKVAVPLGIGTTMAAEVMGARVLTGILDLVLHKSLSIKNVSQCIDAMVKQKVWMWFPRKDEEIEKFWVSPKLYVARNRTHVIRGLCFQRSTQSTCWACFQPTLQVASTQCVGSTKGKDGKTISTFCECRVCL